MNTDRFKFRALRESDKLMIEGSLILDCIDYNDCEKRKPKISGWYEGASFSDFVISETIGQCTGLRDKNDRLIFEGDIVIRYAKKEELEEIKSTLGEAIELLNNDYLGGSGSRGYGAVKITLN